MKKSFLILGLLFICEMSLAIPVVNENVANSGVMTIYPDHADANRYYVAPNVVTIAKNTAGVPFFAYDEYRSGTFSTAAIVQMTLVPAYTRTELDAAKNEILAKNPAAQFSGVPFMASSLELAGELPQIIESHQCNHVGGLIGQEQSCAMTLTKKGRLLFYKALNNKTIFTTLQFYYTIQAVARKADGTFADQTLKYGIAVRIDGDQLSNYPQLIHFR
ncbi:MAG: hypothetical protein H7061_06570 [Bdellovibrionaceae bacterium]|nr:hypothetical protein [Bdellovibrio sp.]